MGFGSDFAGFDDLDANWTFLEGEENEAIALTQAVARRFIMPRGGNPWDPGYGLDLRSYISSTVLPTQAAIAISAEARKDQRVSDCIATITVSDEEWTVVIACTATTGATFSLTLLVSQVTVELLEAA
jgi:hypothetical protein